MPKVTITKSTLINSVDPARRGKSDTMIAFTSDGGGSAFVILPSDKPTYADVQTAIGAYYKGQEHVGKTFDVL